jgi:Uma2 family endonuclease
MTISCAIIVTREQAEKVVQMVDQTAINLMTLDEFIREYERAPFELINGERVTIMPGVALHGLTIRTLFLILYNFCIAHKLGEVLTEMPFVETYNNTWVKGSQTPDIMFFSAVKWAQYTEETENWLKKPFVMIPDLAVEVISPNDNFTEVEEKVDEYLAKGVSLVWLIDPQKKRAWVYEGERRLPLTVKDTLTGGDVLPSLQIPLAELFK